MDSTGIAATYAVTSQAQTQQALQAQMMKMAAAQDASVVALLQSGAESLAQTTSAPPPGMGNGVDVTA